MPRQPRKPSGTGIYHVMMRGINHQNIFEDEEDYYQFISILDKMRIHYDEIGNPCGTNYTLYAYCLMSNHFHLLIFEREESVGESIKRIATSYVYQFNNKYGRDGHLFKERFKSEPVNDMTYFTTLLRYIHQNPVKAGIVSKVKDYEYSSWGEYLGTVDPAFKICNTQAILKRIPFNNLNDWVNDPLPDDFTSLDSENEQPKFRLSDDQVWRLIKEKTGTTNSSAFQHLTDEVKRAVLKELKGRGASHRQLERLTGIGRGLIQKL